MLLHVLLNSSSQKTLLICSSTHVVNKLYASGGAFKSCVPLFITAVFICVCGSVSLCSHSIGCVYSPPDEQVKN